MAKSKPSHEYVYGINPCFEVIRGGRREIKEAFLNKTASESPRIKKLAGFLASRNIPINWVQKDRLFQLSKSKENQGAVVKSSLYPYVKFEDLLGKKKLLLLDNVEDPHNVGAIIRSAEIFGFDAVLLPSRGVPDVYPSVVKVSAGATEHLSIARECGANTYVKRAQAEGYKVVALDEEGREDIKDIKLNPEEKFILVIGGEGKSVGQFIINNADYVAAIRQHGKINSLNASVASGIAMFALGD